MQQINQKLCELNQQILDNAPISIIAINRQGFITMANQHYLDTYGSKNFTDHNVFNSDFFARANLEPDYQRLFLNGVTITRENCLETSAAGENRYFKIIAVPLKDANGNIESALSMAIDNTEMVNLKNRLQALNNELERVVSQRTAEVDLVNRELSKVLELKEKFIADLSSELRNSLLLIEENLANLAKTCQRSANENELYEKILKDLQRATMMMSDFKTVEAATD